jgi:hypothetical protein
MRLIILQTIANDGYYFDHREEIDTELLEENRGADAWRKSHPTASEPVRLSWLRLEQRMATPLYADVHVPGPVILQLRLRG